MLNYMSTSYSASAESTYAGDPVAMMTFNGNVTENYYSFTLTFTDMKNINLESVMNDFSEFRQHVLSEMGLEE